MNNTGTIRTKMFGKGKPPEQHFAIKYRAYASNETCVFFAEITKRQKISKKELALRIPHSREAFFGFGLGKRLRLDKNSDKIRRHPFEHNKMHPRKKTHPKDCSAMAGSERQSKAEYHPLQQALKPVSKKRVQRSETGMRQHLGNQEMIVMKGLGLKNKSNAKTQEYLSISPLDTELRSHYRIKQTETSCVDLRKTSQSYHKYPPVEDGKFQVCCGQAGNERTHTKKNRFIHERMGAARGNLHPSQKAAV